MASKDSQMASKDSNSLATDRSLSQHLKAKSRRRRENLVRLAAAAARPRRNDMLPALEVVDVPLDDLRLPGRKVRVSDPAHVREVASSISGLGFCVPALIGNLVRTIWSISSGKKPVISIGASGSQWPPVKCRTPRRSGTGLRRCSFSRGSPILGLSGRWHHHVIPLLPLKENARRIHVCHPWR